MGATDLAKRTFESVGELESYLTSDLDSILRNQLAPQVEQVLLKHIHSDIYNAYSPIVYYRRNALGSGANIQSTVQGNTLTVKDMTPGNTPIGDGHRPMGNELIGIIETGAQGHGFGKWQKAFARPAVSKAQEEINNGTLVKAVLRKHYRQG